MIILRLINFNLVLVPLQPLAANPQIVKKGIYYLHAAVMNTEE
jgi:hypothetical protein